MATKSKYDSLVHVLPATENHKETFFRIAGDGFLEVEYGRELTVVLEEIILSSFRTMAVNKKIKNMIKK